jgi:hypothetical protein
MLQDKLREKRQRYRANKAKRNALRRATILHVTFKTGSGSIWINNIECTDSEMNGFTGRLSEKENFLLNGRSCQQCDIVDLHTKREREIQKNYDNDYFWQDQIEIDDNESDDDEHDENDDPRKPLAEMEENFRRNYPSDEFFVNAKKSRDRFARAMVNQIANLQERKEEHVKSRRSALLMLFKDDLKTTYWSAYMTYQ